jgi:hypothetical protein
MSGVMTVPEETSGITRIHNLYGCLIRAYFEPYDWNRIKVDLGLETFNAGDLALQLTFALINDDVKNLVKLIKSVERFYYSAASIMLCVSKDDLNSLDNLINTTGLDDKLKTDLTKVRDAIVLVQQAKERVAERVPKVYLVEYGYLGDGEHLEPNPDPEGGLKTPLLSRKPLPPHHR